MNNEIVEDNPNLAKYIPNARNKKPYDFKDRNIKNKPIGMTDDQYRYRGMPLNESSMVGSDGKTVVYGSARDVGNMGAGYIAGKDGLTWQEARFGFDSYQSWSSGRITVEGQPTQRAERIGWNNGNAFYWTNKTKRK